MLLEKDSSEMEIGENNSFVVSLQALARMGHEVRGLLRSNKNPQSNMMLLRRNIRTSAVTNLFFFVYLVRDIRTSAATNLFSFVYLVCDIRTSLATNLFVFVYLVPNSQVTAKSAVSHQNML